MFYFFLMALLLAMLVAGFWLRAGGLRRTGAGIAAAGAFLAVVVTVAAGWEPVAPATVGVKITFGTLDQEELREGPHWVAPWANVVHLETEQRFIEIRTDPSQPNTAIAMTRDEIPLNTLDVSFPYQLSPEGAPRIYARFRANYVSTLLTPLAQSAVREAAARLSWREATVEKREEFRATMGVEFAAAVRRNLVDAGFSSQEAENAFVFPRVQLRAVLPPQRILNANAERQAATVDLERQTVLTQIAEQEAQRRTQEGMGIQNLFSQLPAGYSSEDVYRILAAVALKEQAEAMHRAVIDGRVQTMVIPYGTATAPVASGSIPMGTGAAPVPGAARLPR